MVTGLLCKILGPYLPVSGLAFLVSRGFCRRLRAESRSRADRVTLNLSGMVLFILGMAIGTTHLLWGSALQTIVSLTGIGFVAKRLTLIVVPDWTLRSFPTSEWSLRLSVVAFVAAGLIVGYLSRFG